MKDLSKYLYRITLLFTLPFLLLSVGMFISMLPKEEIYIFFHSFFFIQEKLLKYNLSFFIILLIVDLLSKNFILNIKNMKSDDIKHFVYSLSLSIVSAIVICFLHSFFCETKYSILFIFFIIFVHLFSMIETFQYYIKGKYKNRGYTR